MYFKLEPAAGQANNPTAFRAFNFRVLDLKLTINIVFNQLVADHSRQIHAGFVCNYESNWATTPPTVI
jgi:hypothetical protein